MLSKWRYKICICLVIEIMFPKILDAIERFTKVRIFVIPLFITFLNPILLDSFFLQKLAERG